MSINPIVPLLTICLLAACSDDAAQSPSTAATGEGPPEACALLGPDDLQAVTHVAFQPGEARVQGMCRYTSVAESDSGTPQVLVRLNRYTAGVPEAVERYRDTMLQGLGSSAQDYTVVEVDGTGDHALWETYPGVTQLVVFKSVDERHTDVMIIAPDGFQADERQSVATELARRALN